MDNKVTAKDYFTKDPIRERFYEIFTQMCKRFDVSWTTASEAEKAFIAEMTRFTFESEQNRLPGSDKCDVRPFFG